MTLNCVPLVFRCFVFSPVVPIRIRATVRFQHFTVKFEAHENTVLICLDFLISIAT